METQIAVTTISLPRPSRRVVLVCTNRAGYILAYFCLTFRDICSPTYFGSSQNCGRRGSRQQPNEFNLSRVSWETTGDVRLDDGKFGIPRRAIASLPAPKRIDRPRECRARIARSRDCLGINAIKPRYRTPQPNTALKSTPVGWSSPSRSVYPVIIRPSASTNPIESFP
jgi:hypothetical protein